MSKSKSGTLGLDSLFLGLTRPALVAGVTFSFFSINFLGCTIGFVVTSSFKVFILGGIFHVFGVFLCKKEPLAVDILMTKIQKCPSVSNKNFHNGANSYNMF